MCQFKPTIAAISACSLALILLVAFISYYTVPPLVDFQAHVALGMIKDNSPLLHYYQHQSSLTYRLLNDIVHCWTFFLGNHYAQVALLSYLTVLYLIFLSLYTFALSLRESYLYAFCFLGIICGPAFLILHSIKFVWGLIPFVLSVFMALASSASLWILEDEKNNGVIKVRTVVLFILYTFLVFYSHPAGCVYLFLGWVTLIAYLFFINEKRRTVFPLIMCLMLIPMAFWTASSAMQYTFIRPLDEGQRIYWLLSGGPYHDVTKLIPIEFLGVFGSRVLNVFLTIFPYGVFFCLLCCIKYWGKKYKRLLWFATLQLGFSFILVMMAPERVGQLDGLGARSWLWVSGWAIIGLICLLNLCSEQIFKTLCYLSPMLTIIACLILQPMYAGFRKVPIEVVAEKYSDTLVNKVEELRSQYPHMKNKDIVVMYYFTYDLQRSFYRNWFIYRLVPMLMLNSPKLMEHKIFMEHIWILDKQLPVIWREPSQICNRRKTQIVYWESATPENMVLEPTQWTC